MAEYQFQYAIGIPRDEPFPDLYENADFSIGTIKASIRDGESKTKQTLNGYYRNQRNVLQIARLFIAFDIFVKPHILKRDRGIIGLASILFIYIISPDFGIVVFERTFDGFYLGLCHKWKNSLDIDFGNYVILF